MNLHQYQQEALRFAPPTGTYPYDLQLAVYALGLAGESSEVVAELEVRNPTAADNRKMLLECSDTLWYLAIFCHHLNIPVPEFRGASSIPMGSAGAELTVLVGSICEQIKKHTGMGRELDTDQVSRTLDKILEVLVLLIKYRGQSDLETVLSMNIAKLSARYPNGYQVLKESI